MQPGIDTYFGSPAFQARRRVVNTCWLALMGLFAFALMLPLAGILSYLVYRGASSIDLNFFLHLPKGPGEVGGGVANAIVGSILVTGLGALVAVPVGILGAVYLHEFARGSKLSTAIRFSCDMLNATPSIILGIFAYSMLVITLGRFSALAGAFALAVMMIPIVIRGSEEILRTIPESIRQASLALGASQWQTIWKVVLPAASRGLVTTVFLALARIGGETAPLLFTALGNDFMSFDVTQPINTLPVQIYKFATAPYEDWHRQAWAAALLLVLTISTINAVARYIASRKHSL